MNLVREKVIHKKYGTGEITKLDNDHVYVKFQSVDQEKIFKYPSCFDVDGYLTLENQDIKTTKTSTTRKSSSAWMLDCCSTEKEQMRSLRT